MKRILTLTLTVVLLLSTMLSVLACANNKPKEKTEVDPNGDYIDNLPATMDFGGEEIVIVYAQGPNDNFTSRSIAVDADDGDAVDTEIYNRNRTVENRLNLLITPLQNGSSIQELQSNINTVLQAGSGEYDIIAGYQYYDISMATKGFLVNLNNLGSGDYEGMDYLDLEREYWSTDYIDAISYNNCTYWITGDIALRYIGGMYCTFVNTRIYKNKLESNYGSIYTIAKEGNWTLDLLSEMAALCFEDTGTVPEAVDEADQIGYAWEANDPIDGLAIASDVRFSEKYDDGTISVVLNSSRTIDFQAKLKALYTSSFSYMCADNDSSNVMTAFKNGQVAFTVNKVFQAENYLSEMEDDYYVLPAPKYNAEQTEYVTGLHDGCTLFGIAYDSNNIGASAAALEALCAESYRKVSPVYYESNIKYKYTRDEDAPAMIELIRSNVRIDFVAAWSQSVKDIAHFFRNNYKATSVSNTIKRTQEQWDTALTTLLESLDLYSTEE